MKNINSQLKSFTKKLGFVGISALMILQSMTPVPVLAEATPKTTTFSSELSDNLFEVDGYGDLIIGAIKNADDTVAWCLNKTKPFPHADGTLYQNHPDEANWSWDINGGVPSQDQIKKIKNTIYANNYVFRKNLVDYGLGKDDTMSLYHASQIAQWSFAEGWTPDMVKKSADTVANPTLNALADSIYNLYVDIYNYANDTSKKTYIEGATLWNYEDPTNLIKIGSDITLSNDKVVQEVATGKKYFRSEKMYLIPNQNNGYVFDGDYAYTYNVTVGPGAPTGTRIVNEYGVPQNEFSTRLVNPIGTNFYVEVPQEGVSAGSFSIEVETTKFIRENPMLYTPVNEHQYQAIMQYYGAADHAQQNVKVNYPDGTNLVSVGQINVLKKANQMTGFNKKNSAYGDQYTPQYKVAPLQGTYFEIAYKDTITGTDGVTHDAGEILFGRPVKTSALGYIKVGSVALDANNPTTTFTITEVEPSLGFTLGNNTQKELVITKATGSVVGEIEFVNEPITLNFEFTKKLNAYGTEINGQGAVFGVYVKDEWNGIPAGSLVGTITTNETGKVDNTLLKLPVGHVYEIKELKAPNGYLVDSNVYTVDATINDTNKSETSITVPVKRMDGSVVTKLVNELNYFAEVNLVKVDKEDATIKLSGAKFELYREGADSTVIETVVTDVNGEAKFATKLPVGNYYLKEVTAPTNYEINKEKVPFSVVSEDQKVINLNITNEFKKVAIEVLKIDADTKLPIKDVEFKLYDIADVDLTNALATAKTDSNGFAKFENLKYADYRIVETVLPNGYIGNLVNKSVELTKSPLKDVTRIEVENTPFKATVKAVKVDAVDTNKRLIGAVYELYKKDGTVALATATSDSRGEMEFLVKVPFGSYYIKEKTAPAGYQISDEKIEFTINSTNQKEVTLTAKDSKKFVNIRIEKIDNADSKKFLEGAEFKLYQTSDTELKYPIKTVTTGKDGKITIQGLPIGKYWLIETRSPNGYNLDKQKIVLDLEKLEQNETLVVSVRNVKKSTDPDKKEEDVKKPTITVEKPSTGEEGAISAIYLAVGITLLGIAGFMVFKNKKKESQE